MHKGGKKEGREREGEGEIGRKSERERGGRKDLTLTDPRPLDSYPLGNSRPVALLFERKLAYYSSLSALDPHGFCGFQQCNVHFVVILGFYFISFKNV